MINAKLIISHILAENVKRVEFESKFDRKMVKLDSKVDRAMVDLESKFDRTVELKFRTVELKIRSVELKFNILCWVLLTLLTYLTLSAWN